VLPPLLGQEETFLLLWGRGKKGGFACAFKKRTFWGPKRRVKIQVIQEADGKGTNRPSKNPKKEKGTLEY